MRNALGWAAIGVAAAVLYCLISPAPNETLGGSWWWWQLVAALTVLAIWRDLQSRKLLPS
jgi:membrane associated rhomboid family serine protease